MTGARIFVAVLFLILGASFFASTGAPDPRVPGPRLVRAWSSPTAISSSSFRCSASWRWPPSICRRSSSRDLYWHHLPYGKLRFALGAIVVAAAALDLRQVSRHRAARPIWEVSPAALAGRPRRAARLLRSRRVPAGPILHGVGGRCAGRAKPARPVQLRAQLSCRSDARSRPTRWTRSATASPPSAKLKGAACCDAQRQFRNEITPAAGRSRHAVPVGAATIRIFLPLKVFFILIVVAIGRAAGHVARSARPALPRARSAPSSAASSSAPSPCCSGPSWTMATSRPPTCCSAASMAPQLRYSLVIVPWALLLLFYFLRRLGKQGELIGQIAGVVSAAVAVLRYEQLNDWAVRLLGIGTEHVDRRRAGRPGRARASSRSSGVPGAAGPMRARRRPQAERVADADGSPSIVRAGQGNALLACHSRFEVGQ